MTQRFSGKKVVVTGGAGFIGSHLVDKLVDEGAEVLILDNLSTGSKQNINPKAKFQRVNFVMPTTTDIAILEFRPDFVFHLGAWARMPMCMDDPRGAYANNVMGTLNVLEASRKAKVKKVVLSSSCIVYCKETPYKGSKMALEQLGKIYRESYELPTISLRYGNVYGTRQNIEKDSAMFAMLRKTFNEKGYVEIFGDGEATRDWVHVSDICEANMLAALSEYVGEIDIATGRSLSLNTIVQILGVEAKHIGERKGDERFITMDPAMGKNIGFEAKVKFEDGIKEVWN